MRNVGEYVVNRKQVCKITGIKKINDNEFYELNVIDDDSLKLVVPVNSIYLRDLISKEEMMNLFKKMPLIETVSNNDKLIENEYKKLLNEGTYEDLVKVIKTAYLRNLKRKQDNKKISDIDNEYFLQAEKYLYNELSVVLQMNFEDTKNYVVKMINDIKNS